MKTINVDTGVNSYKILVGRGLMAEFTSLFATYNQKQKWIIITQSNLVEPYGSLLFDSIKAAGFKATMLTIPNSERAKTLAQIGELYTKLIELHSDRSTILIALGGGVVGDVTGFVAATFMRGIQYIQIPTTLLAMIDSAIGGKTGVNLTQGKNLVGSIYQPQSVVIDPKFLNTLPARELVSGFAEMLKYGLIKDLDFFKLLNDNKFILELENPVKTEAAIARSCVIKSKIVSKDEKELGLRRILNFGHTIGHALETYYEYDELRHGEAVAYGMLCSSWISFQKGMISEKEWELIETVIRRLPLPKLSKLAPQQILDIISYDKKNRIGKLHFILLDGIGNAVESSKVTANDIIDSLKILKS